MNENQPQHHEMQLHAVLDTGAEEWFCPVCGRRFLLEWPPQYKKIILEVGDEYAIHTGGKNDPSTLMSQEGQEPKEQNPSHQEKILTEEDEAHLVFWQGWMEENDFDSLWTRDLN